MQIVFVCTFRDEPFELGWKQKLENMVLECVFNAMLNAIRNKPFSVEKIRARMLFLFTRSFFLEVWPDCAKRPSTWPPESAWRILMHGCVVLRCRLCCVHEHVDGVVCASHAYYNADFIFGDVGGQKKEMKELWSGLWLCVLLRQCLHRGIQCPTMRRYLVSWIYYSCARKWARCRVTDTMAIELKRPDYNLSEQTRIRIHINNVFGCCDTRRKIDRHRCLC